jgi:DNA-binding NarL/FixJ family response regulator
VRRRGVTIRVAVADDHALVREGLRSLLATVEGIELVSSSTGAREAVRAAVTDKPDVLVLDINMPDGSGVDVARELQRLAPDVAVLMLTMYDDDNLVFAAMRAGAMGYVLKGADPQEVVRAIQAVAAGNAILGPGVAAHALAYLSRPAQEPAFPTLTPREREVLDLIAAGLSNPAIAHRLAVSPSTVGNHVTNIFGKIQVASRAEAIVKAKNAGMGL